jgi:hypothetical protein
MFAKTLGSKLVVGLDIEGLENTEIEWRSNFLKSQEFVDEVITFKSDLKSIILNIKPEIVIKGSEFSSQFNTENEIVSSYGGELIFSSGSTYFSEKDLLSGKENTSVNLGDRIPKDFLKRNQIDLNGIKNQILQSSKIVSGSTLSQ